jgi:GH25 family lysozyme M1 (1,4-beta-N-acetylmuramidase)
VIRGVDVSGHQGRIDWGRVKRDGIAFAIVKATEGVGWADPKYRAHTHGARAAGVAVGAYHFARPDTFSGRSLAEARRDARAEADWFLAVAQPRPGDLLPALDLETAGLPAESMVAWTRAWLERAHRRLGARPLLYTYPAFWSFLGATRAFRSYPLWIAHYGVVEPQLPGSWRRYAVWQYTASGSVDGIAGRVDVDRLADGTTLADITYRPAEQPAPPKPNLPGPVPKPSWFWPWLRWRLGVAEFEGLEGDERVRPDEAPDEIPRWAFACAEKLVAERRRRRAR